MQGQSYRKRYWNDQYFSALSAIQAVCEKHGLTMAEVALRWISHHSQLKRELGDAVIIGASKIEHIEQNLIDLEKGPLRESAYSAMSQQLLIPEHSRLAAEDVVKALDEAWADVKGCASNYWF